MLPYINWMVQMLDSSGIQLNYLQLNLIFLKLVFKLC